MNLKTSPLPHRLVVVLSTLALMSGCHESVTIPGKASATAGPTDDVDDDQPCVGWRRGAEELKYHTCTGKVDGFYRFEYHGDPDLAVDGLLLCLPSNPEAKPATYRYDCWIHMPSLVFTDGIAGDYTEEIGVCCQEGTANVVAEASCPESVAVEICRANVQLMDDLRRLIPQVGLAGQLYNQLTALNHHIAGSASQVACSGHLEQGLAEEAKAIWAVDDSPEKWPWIRNLRLVTADYHIEYSTETDFSCGEQQEKSQGSGSGSLWDCALTGGLVVEGAGRQAAGGVVGRATLEEGACNAERCGLALTALTLETSDLMAAAGAPAAGAPSAASAALRWPLLASDAAGPAATPLEWGPLAATAGDSETALRSLQAKLRSPAPGQVVGDQLYFPAAGLVFDATLETTMATDPAVGKTPHEGAGALHAELRPESPLAGSFDPTRGALRLAPIVTRNWPLAAELRDLRGVCVPRTAAGE